MTETTHLCLKPDGYPEGGPDPNPAGWKCLTCRQIQPDGEVGRRWGERLPAEDGPTALRQPSPGSVLYLCRECADTAEKIGQAVLAQWRGELVSGDEISGGDLMETVGGAWERMQTKTTA